MLVCFASEDVNMEEVKDLRPSKRKIKVMYYEVLVNVNEIYSSTICVHIWLKLIKMIVWCISLVSFSSFHNKPYAL